MTERILKVADLSDETPLIRRIQIEAADGSALPGYAAGAHITIHTNNAGHRKYSLVNSSTLPDGAVAPRAYVLGVRLDANGEGGSRYMHALKVGDAVSVSGPANDFAVTADTSPVLLLGGGIGITPLISMANEMRHAGRPFRVIYAARARADMAFVGVLSSLAGDALHLHCDDVSGVLDIDAVLAALAPDVAVYACGPKPMLKAAVTASRRLKWPANRLKFELFYSVANPAPVPKPTPAPDGFEVELESSGKVFTIPPDKSILDVLLAAGLDPVHDCKLGNCGICQTRVIAGEPDHRDNVLSGGERATNKVMQICISRSKSARLILDL